MARIHIMFTNDLIKKPFLKLVLLTVIDVKYLEGVAT